LIVVGLGSASREAAAPGARLAHRDRSGIVAIYAATASTIALGWQVFTWRHSRSTRVKVEARMAIVGGPSPETIVAITALNDSEHPVRVSSVGLVLQDGSRRDVVVTRLPAHAGGLPGIVAPHDSGTAHMHFEHVAAAGIDAYRPVTAFVWLSTGERVESKPVALMRR
jgi:hypothetical protein